jgi:hypothetical protein
VSGASRTRGGLGAVALSAVLLVCCSGEVKPEIVAGVDACQECNMVIDTPGHACGFVDAGEFVTFDSPVCLLRNYESRRKQGQGLPVDLYFADHGDGSLHPAERVTFVLTGHVPTVMESGVLCFASRKAAEAAIRHEDERITDWEGYQLARGVPDRVIAVRFNTTGMVPDLVESVKGELLLWTGTSSGLDQDLVVSIKGYPEVGEITIPASGGEVVFRMKASRPGMGFPVMEAGTDKPLGMLKVHGAHTADEEIL